ncbi:MAG: hypothetical protein KJN90_10520 [Gammaproteobacteria bacterium]|nr:hypothetical protein [Gammaproteobacteria bacterium]
MVLVLLLPINIEKSMKIINIPLLLTILLLASACATESQRNFLKMTEEEIYVYNMDKPLMEKVYCFEERQTSTYIRRRQCMTVENYVYRLERAVLALDVLQPSTGVGAFGTIRD